MLSKYYVLFHTDHVQKNLLTISNILYTQWHILYITYFELFMFEKKEWV